MHAKNLMHTPREREREEKREKKREKEKERERERGIELAGFHRTHTCV